VSNVTETLDVNPNPPRRVRAVVPVGAAFLWVFELAAALVVAMPVHGWARGYFGAHPDGDALVFRPGGYALLSWLGDATPALSVVLRTTLVLVVVFGLVGRWGLGLVVGWLGGHGRRAPSTASRAWLPLVVTGALVAAAELFLVGVGAIAAGAAGDALEPRLGDARAFGIRVVVALVFVALALCVHVLSDLNDVALTLAEPAPMWLRLRVAAVEAWRAFGPRAFGAWLWRFALGIALVAFGAWAGDLAGERGGAALVVLFVVHQAVTLGRATLRVTWLERARRVVQRTDL